MLPTLDNMFRVLFDDTPLVTPSPYMTPPAYLSFVLQQTKETGLAHSADIFQIVTGGDI